MTSRTAAPDRHLLLRTRHILTLAIPLACAALFARLGVWQLDRLAERRAFNAMLRERMSGDASHIVRLSGDTARDHYRRVVAAGVPLYDREVIYAGRSRNGSPGINFLTPVRVAAGDSVVLVNRGWVYAPDAKTVDARRWNEGDSLVVAGYVETFAGGGRSAESARSEAGGGAARTLWSLDHAAVERAVGLPVAPFFIVQTSDSATRDSVPVRLASPTLGEGPHRSYAVQWFSFAAIALVGGVVLARRDWGARG